MRTILKHKNADIEIEGLISGRNRITVRSLDEKLFVPCRTWETTYPVDLIEHILDAKGPAWLCDEIMRDESPDYLQKNLRNDLLSHVREEEFRGKRLLDFGCGSGASTMILCRMLPFTGIVGIELNERSLSVAKLRARHYGFDNVTLLLSESADELPGDIGEFEYVVLNAVFEHLLPRERKTLLPQLWNRLKPGGVLFVTETPYRYSLVDFHTTGLPFINYLPDRAAFFFARNFSRRNLGNDTWEDLLKKGIRGACLGEILGSLSCPGDRCGPVLIEPDRAGAGDRFDLWHNHMSTYIERGYPKPHGRNFMLSLMGAVLSLSRNMSKVLGYNIFLSRLSAAIKKLPPCPDTSREVERAAASCGPADI